MGSIRLPRLFALFRFWRKHPPSHELLAASIGFEPPLSVEEAQAQGAMSPADMLEHFKLTGGRMAAAPLPGM